MASQKDGKTRLDTILQEYYESEKSRMANHNTNEVNKLIIQNQGDRTLEEIPSAVSNGLFQPPDKFIDNTEFNSNSSDGQIKPNSQFKGEKEDSKDEFRVDREEDINRPTSIPVYGSNGYQFTFNQSHKTNQVGSNQDKSSILNLKPVVMSEENIQVNTLKSSYDSMGMLGEMKKVMQFNSNMLSAPNNPRKENQADRPALMFLDSKIKILNEFNNDISEKINALKKRLGTVPKQKANYSKLTSLSEKVYERLLNCFNSSDMRVILALNHDIKEKTLKLYTRKSKFIKEYFIGKFSKFFQVVESKLTLHRFSKPRSRARRN